LLRTELLVRDLLRPARVSTTATVPDEVTLLKQENAVLRAQIAWLQQQLFGPGKSEKLDRAQLLLKLGELEKLAAASAPKQTITYERTVAKEKRPLPAENFARLPVQEVVEIIPEPVRAEPEAYERIGEERSFEVDVVPPKLFKREIIRPKYRRKADRAQPLAPAPARPVAGGYASAGLLAWIALSKYVDHAPLYRLEQMSARWGASLPRQSMADWIGITAGWLEPIYRQMKAGLLAGGYVQADETPVRCNDPDEKRGGTTQGWLWVISRPGGDVVFDWRLSRRHGELTSLLNDYKGLLQSDGYEAYPAFAREREGVVWLGCWAHARRKFFEAAAERPKTAQRILQLIARLYRWERAWDKRKIGARRAGLRQQCFARPLARLHRLVAALRQRVLPKSGLGRACAYLLEHWEPLTAHLRFSETRLDNNLIENAIRPSAIGKKNWLFIGHPDAGQRSAIIYSLVVSCQRHGNDPFAYLKDVLTRLPAMTNQDDLAALTPARWSPLVIATNPNPTPSAMATITNPAASE
jgi:transposase